MPNRKCFWCNNICLGLKGQDIVCDTVFALSEAQDKLMIEMLAFGECHLKCLISSRWGRYWSNRILHNFIVVRGLPVIADIDGITAIRNERLKTTFLFGANGWMTEVHDRRLNERMPLDGGFLLPVKEDFYVDLVDYPKLAQAIQSTFLANAAFPLQTLIDELGIQEHILYPAAVQAGWLNLQDSKHLSPTTISAYAEYAEFLPANLVHSMLTNARSVPGREDNLR